jgi:hypothetical protein
MQETKQMIPYFSQSGIPIDQDRIESGRPPSRLEVQQHYLEHQRQLYVQQGRESSGRALHPFGGLVVSFRHSLGRMLIDLGSWMARETARAASSPGLSARR